MDEKICRVPVYNGSEKVIAHVKYNQNLDVWNGSNWQNGGTGQHLGLTMLKDGTPVLIYGTQWQGCRDYAEVVSLERALQEVMRSDQTAVDMILSEKRFGELGALYKEKYANRERE